MNRRSLLVFALIAAATALHAQDRAATPKAAADKQPKVLTFQPDAAIPGATHGEMVAPIPLKNPMLDGPAQIVATFFNSLRDGKIDDGYANLTKGSNIAEKPEELKQLKAKTHEAIELYGYINGFDFVESRAVGQRLVRATYVSQGKVFPLRWRFYFYKPDDVWRLIDLRVDDKLTGIFDEIPEVKTLDTKPTDDDPK